MIERRDVEFRTQGDILLRGWMFVPEGTSSPFPAISMAHGYGGTKYHGIERFARRFAEAGFVVLVHDHRNFGDSEGVLRHDIDPWQQVADWRRAISFLENQPEVDASRIGLWGTSYAGGHVIVLAATDRRVRAVVAQVPTISGYEQGQRRVPPDGLAALEATFDREERAQASGAPPSVQALVSADLTIPAAYRSPDAIDFYLQAVPKDLWRNEVTVQSTRAARMYEPGYWISRVSPTPLMMIVATNDAITLTDLELRAFEQALEPKRLVTIPGGHFDPYLGQFDLSSSAACGWFEDHL
jgi:uncharacterized protein